MPVLPAPPIGVARTKRETPLESRTAALLAKLARAARCQRPVELRPAGLQPLESIRTAARAQAAQRLAAAARVPHPSSLPVRARASTRATAWAWRACLQRGCRRWRAPLPARRVTSACLRKHASPDRSSHRFVCNAALRRQSAIPYSTVSTPPARVNSFASHPRGRSDGLAVERDLSPNRRGMLGGQTAESIGSISETEEWSLIIEDSL